MTEIQSKLDKLASDSTKQDYSGGENNEDGSGKYKLQ